MRDPVEKPKSGKPRPHIESAGNNPPLLKRIKFWLWSLKNRK